MSTNILVTTLGTSWPIVPELFALTNPEMLDLYANSPRRDEVEALRRRLQLRPVGELWVVTTAQEPLEGNVSDLRRWWQTLHNGQPNRPQLRIWLAEGAADLASQRACEVMADLILRVVMHARASVGVDGALYLSVAGGRKTMSADMQHAAHVFGCDGLLHVAIGSGDLPGNQPDDFLGPLPAEVAGTILPLVVSERLDESPTTALDDGLSPERYPLFAGPSLVPDEFVTVVPESLALLNEVRRREAQSKNLLHNFHSEVLAGPEPSNFRGLYLLAPRDLERLRSERIGVRRDLEFADMDWLASLPKPELHCHLGGILSVAQLIEVAASEEQRVADYRRNHARFALWLDAIEAAVRHDDLHTVRQLTEADKTPDWARGLRRRFEPVPEPLTVCGLLQAFTGHQDLLRALVYEHRGPDDFSGIKITAYEQLGDLQGSGLLQSEPTLRAALKAARTLAQQEHIDYLELRCSPANYTRGGLSSKKVLEILAEGTESDHPVIRLVLIASRHGELQCAREHVDLALWAQQHGAHLARAVVGFDLAGDEAALAPSQIRDVFLPLLKQCLRITIHAGEDQPVANIWDAVYTLSADRIGHGLTLIDNKRLLNRFRDRQIAVEMCPTSNRQIVGFKDHLSGAGPNRDYPLGDYLRDGLPVTVNTDNPGISQTHLTRELYQAALLTKQGLRKWDILAILRNGFRASFADFETRGRVLRNAEHKLVKLLRS